jgi:Rieske Fe-S protein
MRDRRSLLKALTALPVIGGVIAILSPLFRYLKPNYEPWRIDTTAGDASQGGPQVIGKTTALAKPWDYFYFNYVQKYPQYDPTGFKASNIPGVAIRVPKKVRVVNPQVGYVGYDGETDVVLFQRICPHLGCIFEFVPLWQNVTAGFGGFTPPASERHALMACPCHFSIYDPSYPGYPGNVISGPAPRGARLFHYTIQGDNIIVDGAESGGLARCPGCDGKEEA